MKQTDMKQVLQLEELAQTALGIAALYYQSIHFNWWLWPILFLSPDISMLGYTINTKVGAFTYNLFHHKGVAIFIGSGFVPVYFDHESVTQIIDSPAYAAN